MEPTCPIQLPKSPQTRMCRVFPRLPVSACFKLSAILSYWHFGICCSSENVNLKRDCKIHGKNEGGQREASFSHPVNKCRVLREDSVCEKFHISFVSAVNTRWTFAKIAASWAGQKKTTEAKTRRAAVTRASPICKNLICIVKIIHLPWPCTELPWWPPYRWTLPSWWEGMTTGQKDRLYLMPEARATAPENIRQIQRNL